MTESEKINQTNQIIEGLQEKVSHLNQDQEKLNLLNQDFKKRIDIVFETQRARQINEIYKSLANKLNNSDSPKVKTEEGEK